MNESSFVFFILEGTVSMSAFEHQFLSLLIRWVHVAAMALMLGGAILLWRLSVQSKRLEQTEHNRLVLFAAERYELLFWLAIGLIVMTGVGNLGAFGSALPERNTEWGQKFVIKLGLVLVFILLSLVRTLLVARLGVTSNVVSLSGIFQSLYAGTTLFAITILFLAVALAHG